MGRALLIAMMSVCLAATPASSQRPVSMDEAIVQVSGQVAAALRGERRLRLAVPDLLDLQGTPTVLGRYFAERLQTRLATDASWFALMERRRVGQVLDELNFGAYDLIQPANARRFGRMIGVDAILVGTLSPLSERVDIDVRIVNIETSEILGAAQASMRRTSDVSSMLSAGQAAPSPSVRTVPAAPQQGVGAKAPGGPVSSSTRSFSRYTVLLSVAGGIGGLALGLRADPEGGTRGLLIALGTWGVSTLVGGAIDEGRRRKAGQPH